MSRKGWAAIGLFTCAAAIHADVQAVDLSARAVV